MSIQKYPVGLQDFKKIRTQDFIYVDKTQYIYQIISKGGYYFLSRPRRFGKSLLVSTMDYLFQGEKDIFEGLYIADKWNFEVYPLIKISFSSLSYENGRLSLSIIEELDEIAKKNGIILHRNELKDKFDELITSLYTKYNQQVVILIDEYDKPIIDYLEPEKLYLAKENRSILKSFYSILKDADPYLKLVFITGISKFSQVSIFSDLNNLMDITLSPDYNEICGISQSELESRFSTELSIYNKEDIRKWYNGYRWDIDRPTVYNPFSLLRFFSDGGKFFNFWYTTGTPTFLLELGRDIGMYELESAELSFTGMNSFNFDHLQLIPLLFQTGYLTITGFDQILHIYKLGFPNLEVKSSYIEGLLETYGYQKEPKVPTTMSKLLRSLKSNDPAGIEESINGIFEHIPYPLWEKENEHFYHAIIHLLFSLLGVYIHSEVHTKDGRADAIIILDEGVYCLEFKLDKSAVEAVSQVIEKGYLSAYLDKEKPCHIIGINFSSKVKKVDGLIWEEIQGEK